MNQPLLVILIILLAATGCSSFEKGDRQAAATALVVHRQVLELKRQVSLKVSAEQNYYRNQVKTHHDARSRSLWVQRQRLQIKENQAIAQALRDQSGGEEDWDMDSAALSDSLIQSADRLRENLEADTRANREARAHHEASIKKLGSLNKEFSALESSLLELMKPPSKREEVVRLGVFLTAVAKEYKKLGESQQQNGQDGSTTPTD